MSAFHVDYRTRLTEVLAALAVARQENRTHDAVALELAARVLEGHVGELESRRVALV